MVKGQIKDSSSKEKVMEDFAKTMIEFENAKFLSFHLYRCLRLVLCQLVDVDWLKLLIDRLQIDLS